LFASERRAASGGAGSLRNTYFGGRALTGGAPDLIRAGVRRALRSKVLWKKFGLAPPTTSIHPPGGLGRAARRGGKIRALVSDLPARGRGLARLRTVLVLTAASGVRRIAADQIELSPAREHGRAEYFFFLFRSSWGGRKACAGGQAGIGATIRCGREIGRGAEPNADSPMSKPRALAALGLEKPGARHNI